jgi:hypothetical protein
VHASVRPKSHTRTMWTEVSSSVPHFLQMGSLYGPMKHKCLLKELCPISRPITTLDCVLLKVNNRAPIARPGPESKSPSLSLCTTGAMPQCQMLFLHPGFHLFFYILPKDPQEKLRSSKPLNTTIPCEYIGHFFSSHSGM